MSSFGQIAGVTGADDADGSEPADDAALEKIEALQSELQALKQQQEELAPKLEQAKETLASAGIALDSAGQQPEETGTAATCGSWYTLLMKLRRHSASHCAKLPFDSCN